MNTSNLHEEIGIRKLFQALGIAAIMALGALAGGLKGWLFRKASGIERTMLIVAGVLPVYPKALLDIVGIDLFALVIALQLMKKPMMATDLRG